MKLTTIALSMIVGLSAHAASFQNVMGGLEMSETAQNIASQFPKTTKRAACPDLSGTWVGTCSSDKKTENTTWVIEQKTCTEIKLGGHDLGATGFQSFTASPNLLVRYVNVLAGSKWSQAGVLNFQAIMAIDTLFDHRPFNGRVTGSVNLQGDTLSANADTQIYEMSDLKSEAYVTCQFKKQ